MAMQPNKLILDTELVEDLKCRGYTLLEYNAKYVTVSALAGYEHAFNLWLIEDLENALNAEFMQFLSNTALLRWRN